MLKTTTEDLLRQDGVFIHQEIRDTGHGSASTGNIYNYGIEKEVVDRLLAGKDEEIQHFKDGVKYLIMMELPGKVFKYRACQNSSL